MYGLDLFSGIGGITKALEGYVRPVAYCENDRYAQGVLLSRMFTGDLPVAPVWDDVSTLHGAMLPPVDCIYGGFPCQDLSVAGRRAGLDGKRSGLFFQICRLASETKAPFIFLENVPGIRTKGLGRVLKELDKLGYDCRWGLLSAADVGANHKRERWFLLAHSNNTRLEGRISGSLQERAGERPVGEGGTPVADAKSQQDWWLQSSGFRPDAGASGCGMRTKPRSNDSWWEAEPNVGRVAHGIPKRVDRLRALGNAVVPAQAREAFERLMGLK